MSTLDRIINGLRDERREYLNQRDDARAELATLRDRINAEALRWDAHDNGVSIALRKLLEGTELMPLTKKELLAKLEVLAERWESGATVDAYDTGECTDTATAYVSKCAEELRILIAETD